MNIQSGNEICGDEEISQIHLHCKPSVHQTLNSGALVNMQCAYEIVQARGPHLVHPLTPHVMNPFVNNYEHSLHRYVCTIHTTYAHTSYMHEIIPLGRDRDRR